MKTIFFTKMAGAGNDFIVLQQWPKKPDIKELAVRMCNRTNGIGADGLLLLTKGQKNDYTMRIINSDGSEAEMCGNGVRCLAAYIVKHLKPKKKLFRIATKAGIILAEAKGEVARVRLSDPVNYQPNIPLDVEGRSLKVSYIDTGVPHVVIFVEGLEIMDVNKIGPAIRFHERFKPRGANVNFVEYKGEDFVAARTYERGVEGETKACGTGSVAAGIISYLNVHADLTEKETAKIKVLTKSGEVLNVSFKKKNGHLTDVWLKGSAKFIAKGEYYV